MSETIKQRKEENIHTEESYYYAIVEFVFDQALFLFCSVFVFVFVFFFERKRKDKTTMQYSTEADMPGTVAQRKK
jgi:hypothetical protein